MTADPAAYEKLGAFYLGRVRDVDAGRTTDELLLLDSSDLTTHAVCVGMTGSGKTGLCVALLEEAALDSVPAIAIDPKGDLGNLLLTFPSLEPGEFRPWIDEAEAAREGRTPDEHAAAVAGRWRQGLADWGQDGGRIARLRAAADVALFTPGSTAGTPLSVLRSFAAPPPEALADEESWRERVLGTASSLLALAGVESDPMRGREHVLLATILDGAWREGRSPDLAGLIEEIRSPRFTSVGVVDVESFYPAKERFELALRLNALAASPAFAAWIAGEPLDVARLLRAPDGRPRLSIVSIAHLSDPERMFVVTLLLQEVLQWARRQPGTGSLRALLFMDEVFGYLPPTAAPPSKRPLLTLLKQARAHGLGIVLATQNPADLDYKALSNAGTWMLGRLQAERDKLRVLDGLEGASSGGAFDRARLDALLSGLGKRQFVLGSAHEPEPVVFESRWAMSWLRGPLTRPQIQALCKATRAEPAQAPAPAAAGRKPLLPPGVAESFLPAGDGPLRPRLLARARLHHVSAKERVDAWREVALLADIPAAGTPEWDAADVVGDTGVRAEPAPGATYLPLPGPVTEGLMAAWSKSLAAHLHAASPLLLLRCAPLGLTSSPDEDEGTFRAHVAHAVRERRDAQVAALREKHAPKAARLAERLRKAEQKVAVQREQASAQRTNAAISAGGALLGALFGRRGAGLGRLGTAARGFGRASQEGQDVARAEADVAAVRDEAARLEEELQADLAALPSGVPEITRVEVPPRKSDVTCTLCVAWT